MLKGKSIWLERVILQTLFLTGSLALFLMETTFVQSVRRSTLIVRVNFLLPRVTVILVEPVSLMVIVPMPLITATSQRPVAVAELLTIQLC